MKVLLLEVTWASAYSYVEGAWGLAQQAPEVPKQGGAGAELLKVGLSAPLSGLWPLTRQQKES